MPKEQWSKKRSEGVWGEETDDGLADSVSQNDAGVKPPAPLLSWMPRVPLFFLGLGLYRAWIEMIYATPLIEFPSSSIATQNVYDVFMALTLLMCSLLARRVGPFFGKRSLYTMTAVLMIVGTLSQLLSLVMPGHVVFLGWSAALCGGVGTGLIILLWSELYGCLNPFRVVLYYSASLVVSALVIYLCRSLDTTAFVVVAVLLPLVSVASVAAGFRSLPSEHLPRSKAGNISIPWRIILIMGVYGFAYGLKAQQLYQGEFGPHSAIGVVLIATVMFLLVAVRGKSFEFSLIFRIALPLAVAAFLLVPSVGVWSSQFSNFCISASYTAFSIFVMVVLANLSYRYGASAILLFGLERGLRACFILAGRGTDAVVSTYLEPDTGGLLLSSLVVVLVIVATMMLVSDKTLLGRWSLARPGMHRVEDDEEARRALLSQQCSAAAQAFGLSQREVEVLQLLAQQKKISTIEQELFISTNTAKTHIRHIYRKFDIHSREELLEVLQRQLPSER